MKADLPLLLRNATLHDGLGTPGRVGDLLIHHGQLRPLAEAPPEARVLDLAGCHVSPGWVDLHTHVFEGHGLFSLPPEEAGLFTGVTTLVDAGSAGSLNFPAFLAQAARRVGRERVVGYVNVSNGGLLHGHAGERGFLGEHAHPALHTLEPALALHTRHGGEIVGWKARLSRALAHGDAALERGAWEALLTLRERTGLPLMVHHIASSLPVAEVLGALQAGDVYTHCYHGLGNAPFEDDSGHPTADARAARGRGVLFDVGHGVGAFRWACAQGACVAGGFWPDAISTDVHAYNLFSPVRNLAGVMSRFLHLGLPLERVVAAVTGGVAPALRHLGIAPTLEPGRRAELTLFQLEEGRFPLADCAGEERVAPRRITPLAVLLGERLTPCYGFHARPADADALARAFQSLT